LKLCNEVQELIDKNKELQVLDIIINVKTRMRENKKFTEEMTLEALKFFLDIWEKEELEKNRRNRRLALLLFSFLLFTIFVYLKILLPLRKYL
jgi:type IV secretory pathway component VirB8